MAEEDEIDVLGDFSLDVLSNNEDQISYDNPLIPHTSELLECDYTLNSSWLIDHGVPTNSEVWYSTDHDFNHEDSHTSLGFDDVICDSSKPNDDSDWSEHEKSLLEKGLDMYGKSYVRLSQFIGSKSPLQIKYYINNVYNASGISNSQISNGTEENTRTKSDSVSFVVSDIIEDAQIPASIEEVIAAVSTAKPTVHNITKKSENKRTKQKYIKDPFQPPFEQNILPLAKKKKSPDFKLLKNAKKSSFKRTKKKVTEGFTIDETVQKYEVKPIVRVSSGEELIKITKEDSDVDVDTDIEVDIDDQKSYTNVCETSKIPETNQNSTSSTKEEFEASSMENSIEENLDVKIENLTKNIDKNVLTFLNSLDAPQNECIVEENSISDVEKFIHSEFFEGRSVKTPSRYLKIRNYIIDYWKSNKPTYCTKTSVRIGLKNCGDVNCIGRIHQFLEQIGAINFGCSQVQYIRPLLRMVIANTSVQCEKPKKELPVVVAPQRSDLVRARVKKKFNNDGEGGYTMIHDENGEVIDTTVINTDKQNKPRTYRKNIKLVSCRSFTSEYPAPYTIELNLSALLIMDLHAHSALIEVMGLLGGIYNSVTRVLQIIRYVPCRSMDYSNTHCDMCPVSQSEASEILQAEGLEIIGWFHTHPTFYPNPSLQDIDTQLSMQEYLSSEYSPFVGLILSPYRSFANNQVSEYNCLIVDKEQTTKDGVGIPYKFLVNVTSRGFSIMNLLRHAQCMLNVDNNIPSEFIVDFMKSYFQDDSITYLEKFLASVKVHFARCSDINKMTCDAITECLSNICLKISNKISNQ